jgi:hypothetical protein
MPGHPPISFSTFVISLASSGLTHLGVQEPGAPARPVDLVLARQTIDLLGILAQKTKGNLESDEAQLLDAVQKELTQRFEAASVAR